MLQPVPVVPGAVRRARPDRRRCASLSAAQKQRVIDLCYGCKLCEVRCPYTPHDGHEFQLDFPRLMLRARAVEGREHGLGMREKMLGNPDRLGKLGSMVPKLANWACRSPFQRAMMEKMLGISRDKQLPEFAGETFETWLERTGIPPRPPSRRPRSRFFRPVSSTTTTRRRGARWSRCSRATDARSHRPSRTAAGCRRSTAATSPSRKSTRARMSPRCCRWCARATESPRSIQPAR